MHAQAKRKPSGFHELSIFPHGKHDDQADSTSQALDWGKQRPTSLPLHEFYERQILRERLGLPDEYFFIPCDEAEEIIAEHFRTGERIRRDGRNWVACNRGDVDD